MGELRQAGTLEDGTRVLLPMPLDGIDTGGSGSSVDTSEIEVRLASLEAALKEGVIYGPFFSLSPQVVRGEVVFAVYAYSNAGGIAKFVVNIPELGIEDQEYAVAREGLYGNSARITFTVPEDMAIDTEINVSVYATDTKGASTLTITKTVTVCDGIIAPPNITSPASGASVYGGNNPISFVCSAFSASGLEDIENKYADWKITRDQAGEDILSCVNGSYAALTNHTVNGFGLTNGDGQAVDLFVHARHGCDSGVSEWGVPTLIKSLVMKELPSGRRIGRHPSGAGSVLEWEDTTKKHKTLIADHSYYVNVRMDTKSYTASGNWGGVATSTNKNVNNNGYLNGLGVIAVADRKYITDDEINKLWGSTPSGTAATAATTIIYNIATTTQAAHAARNISLAGVAASIPSRNIGFRIFCESEFIQALDPSTGRNVDKLYDLNPNGVWHFGTSKYNGIWTCSLVYPNSGGKAFFYLGAGGVVNIGVCTEYHLLVPIVELE